MTIRHMFCCTLGNACVSAERASDLSAVHKAGLLHGDARASNFLLLTDCAALSNMLVDFGFAVLSSSGGKEYENGQMQSLLRFKEL